MTFSNKPSFEENYDFIFNEINKRRRKWMLQSITFMDFDDVKSIILYHIYKKWNQYNPLLPLGPWVGKIINNQIINIARNIYTNHQPPCTKCAAAESANSCRIYGER